MTVLSRPPASTGSSSSLAALLRLLRLKQWAKNTLVLAAPGAAGVLLEPEVLGRVLLATAAFCALSGAVYILNDALDVAADRVHPTKRLRPLASGAVSLRLAGAAAVVLALAALGAAAAVSLKLLLVFVIYAANSVAYSLGLKHEATVELVAVAAGFVLRALAGAVAADVPVSNWFLIVTSFGALFVVAGKRHGELMHLDGLVGTRASLQLYTIDYLRGVWLLAAGVTTTAYCLWAFEQGSLARHPLTYQLSVLPFVLALLRYALLLEQGRGGEPEDVILGDRRLAVLGVLWIAVFGVGVALR